jgi:hypothetical protein
MLDNNLAAVCGIYCGTCQHLGNKCQGCGHGSGNGSSPKPHQQITMLACSSSRFDGR